MKTSETLNGVKVPRPTDRSYSLGLFFTDYFPKIPRLKFSLRGIFMQGLPSTAPRSTRDVESDIPKLVQTVVGIYKQRFHSS